MTLRQRRVAAWGLLGVAFFAVGIGAGWLIDWAAHR